MTYLKYSELAEILGVTTEALRQRVRRAPDEYPPPVHLGKRTVRFAKSTVDTWLAAKNIRGTRYEARLSGSAIEPVRYVGGKG